jgi:hypothetical protein
MLNLVQHRMGFSQEPLNVSMLKSLQTSGRINFNNFLTLIVDLSMLSPPLYTGITGGFSFTPLFA